MKRHALILLVALGAAPAVGAQTAIDVRTSFGATNYKQNDLEYAAPEVRVAVRAGSERFAVEPELGFAWGSTTDTSHQFRNLGVNAIARARGRVSPFFGGGIGVYSERQRIGGEWSGGYADIRAARRHADRLRRGMSGPRHASVCSVRAASKRDPSATPAAAARFRGLQASPSPCADAPRRASRSAQSIAELRRRYVDGPVLIVPRAGSGTLNTTGSTSHSRRGHGLPGNGEQRRMGVFRCAEGRAYFGRRPDDIAAGAGRLRGENAQG